MGRWVDPTPLFTSLQGLINNDGQPPDPPDDDMQIRLAKLEAIAEKTGERLNSIDLRLLKIETELGAFKQEAFRTFATKEDLAKLEVKMVETNNKTIMWVVSAVMLAQLLPALLKKFGL